MTTVITGDIVNSQNTTPGIWLAALKKELNKIGPSPQVWEIYRGDSFQVEVSDPMKALEKAIRIKASIKCIKGLDVRMAIGLGEKSHSSGNILESNGTAFIFSGEKFEQLTREKQTLAIASAYVRFDRDINLYIRLALIIMDNWSVNSAEMVKLAMDHPEITQAELGELLGIKQNAISYRLKRAAFDEIGELLNIYRVKLKELI